MLWVFRSPKTKRYTLSLYISHCFTTLCPSRDCRAHVIKWRDPHSAKTGLNHMDHFPLGCTPAWLLYRKAFQDKWSLFHHRHWRCGSSLLKTSVLAKWHYEVDQCDNTTHTHTSSFILTKQMDKMQRWTIWVTYHSISHNANFYWTL